MDVETLILSEDCPPLLMHNAISDWPANKWTPEFLAKQLPSHTSVCKLAPLHSTERLWETECEHVHVSLVDFVEWLRTDKGSNNTAHQLKGDNPLQKYDRKEYSCYLDYKYMVDFFLQRQDLLEDVKWKNLGLGELDGRNSTIWIGSEGCYTNCHYDTYGFNLVAQIYGRKKWTLFPPTDTTNMYATRIPYEESSVFSEVNLANPDFVKHDRFKFSQPYVVTLEPGDVLYVPRQWWHYVECLEPAISINTWVDTEEDKEARLHEAVTMTMISCFIETQKLLKDDGQWLNQGEAMGSPVDTVELLHKAWSPDHRKQTNQVNRLTQFAQHFRSVLPKSTIKRSKCGTNDKPDTTTCHMCGQALQAKRMDRNLPIGKRKSDSGHELTTCKSQKVQYTESGTEFTAETNPHAKTRQNEGNIRNCLTIASVENSPSVSGSQEHINMSTGDKEPNFQEDAEGVTDIEVFVVRGADIGQTFNVCSGKLVAKGSDQSTVAKDKSICRNLHQASQGQSDCEKYPGKNKGDNSEEYQGKTKGDNSEEANREKKNNGQTSDSVKLFEDLVKCATHPDVVQMIVNKMKQRMK